MWQRIDWNTVINGQWPWPMPDHAWIYQMRLIRCYHRRPDTVMLSFSFYLDWHAEQHPKKKERTGPESPPAPPVQRWRAHRPAKSRLPHTHPAPNSTVSTWPFACDFPFPPTCGGWKLFWRCCSLPLSPPSHPLSPAPFPPRPPRPPSGYSVVVSTNWIRCRKFWKILEKIWQRPMSGWKGFQFPALPKLSMSRASSSWKHR